MKHSITALAACSLAFLLAPFAMGGMFYVATNGIDAAGRGSEENPFKTIQYAIDSATADSTIWVKPGVYDEGGATNTEGNGGTHMNRVVLTKRVHLKSTDGAAVTHIVGAPDPDTGGIGPGAVRCIVSPNANSQNSSIIGFTLRDGYGDDGTTGHAHRSGGFLQYNGNKWIYISDCVISNCAAYTHGGARGGTFSRCLFRGNRSNHATTDGADASAVGAANLIHCVIVGNGDTDDTGAKEWAVSQSTLVNCTIICNRGRSGSNSTNPKNTYYNTVICGNAVSDRQSVHTYNSSVTDGYPVFSPLFGDYRIVAGSAADSAGNPSYLANVPFTVMSGMAETDFAGNAVDTSGANVHVGAVQETVATDGGILRLTGPFTCNGVEIAADMPTYLQTTNHLEQWRIQCASRKTVGSTTTYLRNLRRYPGPQFSYPDTNDSFVMMVPPKSGYATTNTLEYCKALWVDPVAGSDQENDGSENSPFATIQRAVDAGGAQTVVYLAPGIYAQGGASCENSSAAPYGNSRVWIGNPWVRIVGMGGAERTFIVGTPDSATGGFGDGAVRCIGTTNSYVVISGVTLSNGWTRAESAGGLGAAICGGSAFLTDAVVTDCHGFQSVLCNAYALRCKIFGNESQNDSLVSTSGRVQCSWIGPNVSKSSAYFGYIGSYVQCWFSTLIVTNGQSAFSQSATVYNCLAIGGQYVKSAMTSKGNLFWRFAEIDAVASGTFTDANPRLDQEKIHVREDSPALVAGVAPSESGWNANDAISRNWFNYSSADVEGNLLRFNADGTATVGAAHETFPAIRSTTLFIR